MGLQEDRDLIAKFAQTGRVEKVRPAPRPTEDDSQEIEEPQSSGGFGLSGDTMQRIAIRKAQDKAADVRRESGGPVDKEGLRREMLGGRRADLVRLRAKAKYRSQSFKR